MVAYNLLRFGVRANSSAYLLHKTSLDILHVLYLNSGERISGVNRSASRKHMKPPVVGPLISPWVILCFSLTILCKKFDI